MERLCEAQCPTLPDADLPLGRTDACLVDPAERLNITNLAKLDHRHFNVVRPRHVQALTLVP